MGYDLMELSLHGDRDKLKNTRYAQPAIYVASLAMLKVLEQTGPNLVQNVNVAAGFSLGEYTALTFAGVFSFERGITLVKARAEVMEEAAAAQDGKVMTVLECEDDKLHSFIAEVKSEHGKQHKGVLQVANRVWENFFFFIFTYRIPTVHHSKK